MNNSSWDTFRDNDIRRNSYFRKSTTLNMKALMMNVCRSLQKVPKWQIVLRSAMMQFYLISMYGPKTFVGLNFLGIKRINLDLDKRV